MPSAPVTDTAQLPVPAWLEVPGSGAVREQRVAVSASWWEQRLDARGLPGGPLRVRSDAAGEDLTRSDVWQVATDGTDSDQDVLGLLWHALAWGAGTTSVRNEQRRLDSVAADPAAAAALLRRASALAAHEPEAAYAVLHPSGRGVLKQLGPAFGTKFLYFAGRGAAQHATVILDRRVATALTRAGWTSLVPSGGWPATTYGRYCTLARRWADGLSVPGRDVHPDQVEYACPAARRAAEQAVTPRRPPATSDPAGT